jgi:hypothetical protein
VADQIPETEVPSASPPVPAAPETGVLAWMKHPYLPHAQAVVGLLAGILSIGGFAYSYLWATTPVPPTHGEVIAIAVDARTEKPIPDATIEVLTSKDALVTTLTPDASGRARHAIKEGSYRLRAGHPKFTTEVRQIHVIGGNTAEIRVRLQPRVAKAPAAPAASPTPGGGTAKNAPAPAAGSSTSSSSGSDVGKAVDEGVNAVKKIFR